MRVLRIVGSGRRHPCFSHGFPPVRYEFFQLLQGCVLFVGDADEVLVGVFHKSSHDALYRVRMIKFADWIKLRESGTTTASVAGVPSAPAQVGGESGGNSGGGTPHTGNSDGGTTTGDVARVPMRLGCCGFCYPYCKCGHRKKRKKRRGKRRK